METVEFQKLIVHWNLLVLDDLLFFPDFDNKPEFRLRMWLLYETMALSEGIRVMCTMAPATIHREYFLNNALIYFLAAGRYSPPATVGWGSLRYLCNVSLPLLTAGLLSDPSFSLQNKLQNWRLVVAAARCLKKKSWKWQMDSFNHDNQRTGYKGF